MATEAEADRKAEVREYREVVPGKTGFGRTINRPVVTRGTATRGVLMDGEAAVAAPMQDKSVALVLPEVEPSWLNVSSHRIILDGCFSQGRKEPGGSSVGKTTTSLPPGRQSQREV